MSKLTEAKILKHLEERNKKTQKLLDENINTVATLKQFKELFNIVPTDNKKIIMNSAMDGFANFKEVCEYFVVNWEEYLENTFKHIFEEYECSSDFLDEMIESENNKEVAKKLILDISDDVMVDSYSYNFPVFANIIDDEEFSKKMFKFESDQLLVESVDHSTLVSYISDLRDAYEKMIPNFDELIEIFVKTVFKNEFENILQDADGEEDELETAKELISQYIDLQDELKYVEFLQQLDGLDLESFATIKDLKEKIKEITI